MSPQLARLCCKFLLSDYYVCTYVFNHMHHIYFFKYSVSNIIISEVGNALVMEVAKVCINILTWNS